MVSSPQSQEGKKKMEKVKYVFISIFGAVTSLLGSLTVPVLLMVACNVIDYITGLAAAKNRGKKVDSQVGLFGIIKKICMWLLVVVGAIIDQLLLYAVETIGLALPFSFLVACIVCIWLVCNELLSILENISDIGVPMPGFLRKVVLYIKHQAEGRAKLEEEEEEEDDD